VFAALNFSSPNSLGVSGSGTDAQMTKRAMDKTKLHPQLANNNSPAAPHRPPSVAAARLTAIGGILGAIAASSCCLAPLVLFSLGISGAWIANLTALAPYQPYFIAATLACLIYGYWLVYRRKPAACAEGAVCSRPLPNRIVLTGLVLATVLVAGAIGADLIGPYLNP
jgi:mercuric ion transport protein